MEKLKISNDIIDITDIKQEDALLKISFVGPENLTGLDLSKIDLLTEGGLTCRVFEGYTTIYRISDNVVILSNDGSVYIEPVAPIVPDPSPYVPTLEETKNLKILELNAVCESKIIGGFMSSAFDGTTQVLYDSKITDQSRVNGLVSIAQLRLLGFTTEIIKWKNANESECTEWTPNQMLALGLDMKRHIENATEKYDSLKVYINSRTNIDDVQQVTWDFIVP